MEKFYVAGKQQAVSFPWAVMYLLAAAESSITPDMLMQCKSSWFDEDA